MSNISIIISSTTEVMKTMNPFDPEYVEEITFQTMFETGLAVNFDESALLPKDRGPFYYMIVTIFLFCMLVSFIFNVYFIAILIRLRKSLRDRPFFRIVWQLVIANIISVFANAGTSFPVLFFLSFDHTKIFLKSYTYSFFAAIDETGDQIVLFCVLLIAIHRLLIFTISKRSEKFFSRYILNPLLVLIWIIAIGSSLVFWCFQCSFKYLKVTFLFEYSCSNLDYTTAGIYDTIGNVLQSQLFLFPLACLTCYIIILIVVILQKMELVTSASNSLEKEILIQAILLFVAFEINTIAVYISMNIKTENIAFYIRKIVNTIEFLSGLLTPLFFLATNREIKEAALKLNPISSMYHKCYVRVRKPSSIPTVSNGTIPARQETD